MGCLLTKDVFVVRMLNGFAPTECNGMQITGYEHHKLNIVKPAIVVPDTAKTCQSAKPMKNVQNEITSKTKPG